MSLRLMVNLHPVNTSFLPPVQVCGIVYYVTLGSIPGMLLQLHILTASVLTDLAQSTSAFPWYSILILLHVGQAVL
jgi:hypothetical protein